jgi:hypothetical protein
MLSMYSASQIVLAALVGSRPISIALSPDGRSAFITHADDNTILTVIFCGSLMAFPAGIRRMRSWNSEDEDSRTAVTRISKNKAVA